MNGLVRARLHSALLEELTTHIDPGTGKSTSSSLRYRIISAQDVECLTMLYSLENTDITLQVGDTMLVFPQVLVSTSPWAGSPETSTRQFGASIFVEISVAVRSPSIVSGFEEMNIP